jgi:hypothetical protein
MPPFAQSIGRASWKLLALALVCLAVLAGCAPLQKNMAGMREALSETRTLASPSGGPIAPQAQQIDRNLQR